MAITQEKQKSGCKHKSNVEQVGALFAKVLTKEEFVQLKKGVQGGNVPWPFVLEFSDEKIYLK